MHLCPACFGISAFEAWSGVWQSRGVLGSSSRRIRARWARITKTSALPKKMAEARTGESVVWDKSSAGADAEDERNTCQGGSEDAQVSSDGDDAYVNVEVCLGLGGGVVLRHTFARDATIGNLQAELERVLGQVVLEKIGRFVLAQDADAARSGFENDEADAGMKCFVTAVGRRVRTDGVRTGRRVVITAILERHAGLRFC